MTITEILNILIKLGMIDTEITDAEELKFFNLEQTYSGVGKDLADTMNFVDELTTYNDLESIRKFLTILFMATAEQDGRH